MPVKKTKKKASQKKRPVRSSKKKPTSNKIKIYIILSGIFLILSSYYIFFLPNINIDTKYCYFYIPPNSTTSAVYDSLESRDILKSSMGFWMVKKLLNFTTPKEGLYKLNKNWGNLWLVGNLKKGNTQPWFSCNIPSLRSRASTVKRISRQANINYKEFSKILNDSVFLAEKFNLNRESVYCLFIPGEYKFPKMQTGKELLTEIYNEYHLFWTEERKELALELECTKEDVIKLASIVYAETKNKDEMPLIAGIYLNRLKKNMLLQADPTLMYARNFPKTRRVYFNYAKSTSRYNTYKYKGLPPGPIGPSPAFAIESVLNSSKHNYLYFCAKEDQSGCHYFAEDYEEHKKYASRYRKMLNKKRIR